MNNRKKVLISCLIPLLLVILVVLVYGKSYSFDFVWDDRSLIVDNPTVRSGENIFQFFSPSYWNNLHPGTKGQYRPLRTVTFRINYLLGRFDPSGYHLFNIIIHTLVVLSLYYFITVLTKNNWLATWASMFYAVFPTHCENVLWVKNRSEMLAALFIILSMIFFIHFFRSMGSDRKIRSLFFLSISLVSYVLALSGKENAIILLMLVVLWLLCYGSSLSLGRISLYLLPYGAITIGYALVHIFLLIKVMPDVQTSGYTFWGNMSQISITIMHYLRFLVFPYPLNADRGDAPIVVHSFIPVIPLLIIILVGVYGFYRWRAKEPFIFFSFFWIFVSLGPVSNIISITGRPLADQRMYIPALGFCMLLAGAIDSSKERLRVYWGNGKAYSTGLAVSLLIFAGYLFIIVPHVSIWKNDFTLWNETIRNETSHGRPEHNLGLAYMREEDFENAGLFLKKALEMSPHNHLVYCGLGQLFFSLDRQDEAITALKDAIKLVPEYPASYNSLSEIYITRGDLTLAEGCLKKALEIQPFNAITNNNLGAVYLRQGDYDEAMKYFTAALKTDPRNVKTHLYLSILHLLSDDPDKALQEYSKSFALGLSDMKTLIFLAQGFFEKGQQNVLKAYLQNADIMSDHDINSMLILGEIFAVSEDYEKALAQLKLVIEKDSSSSLGYALLGRIYLKMDDPVNSLQAFKKAYDLDPDKNQVSFDIGCLYLQMKMLEEASSYLKQYVDYFPGNRNGRLKYAECLSEQGDHEQAVNILKKLQIENPNSGEASLALAQVFGRMGDNDLAIAEYKNALRFGSETASVHYNMAISNEELARYAEAEKNYKEAIRLDPSFYQAFINLGILTFKNQRFEDAEKLFQRALSLSETSNECKTYLSLIYYIQGKLQEARKLITSLIHADYRIEYNLLFLSIVERKSGEESSIDTIIEHTRNKGCPPWPCLLLKFYAHLAEEADLNTFIRDQPSEKQQELEYERDVYVAMRLLENGENKKARHLLEQCVNNKKQGVFEYYLALGELPHK